MLKKALVFMAITLFVLSIILIIILSNGYELNLQFKTGIDIFMLLFWTSILLFSVRILIADIGIIRGAGIFGIALAILVLSIEGGGNISEYETIHSDDYELFLVSYEMSNDKDGVNVYKKENAIYSRFIDYEYWDDNYTATYEIIGDTLVIELCDVVCGTEVIIYLD